MSDDWDLGDPEVVEFIEAIEKESERELKDKREHKHKKHDG